MKKMHIFAEELRQLDFKKENIQQHFKIKNYIWT